MYKRGHPRFWKDPLTHPATGGAPPAPHPCPSLSTWEHLGSNPEGALFIARERATDPWLCAPSPNPSYQPLSLLWVLLQLRPQGHGCSITKGVTQSAAPLRQGQEALSPTSMLYGWPLGGGNNVTCAGWVGTQAWFMKHNDAFEGPVPQLTHGRTEINLNAISLSGTAQNGLFKDTPAMTLSFKDWLNCSYTHNTMLGWVWEQRWFFPINHGRLRSRWEDRRHTPKQLHRAEDVHRRDVTKCQEWQERRSRAMFWRSGKTWKVRGGKSTPERGWTGAPGTASPPVWLMQKEHVRENFRLCWK